MLDKISSIQNYLTPLKSADNNINYNNKLERTPYKDTVSFGAAKKVEISPELKKVLDETTFTFKRLDGETFKGTIREYLNNSKRSDGRPLEYSIIHCTGSKQTAESILKEGLDWTKTGRMKAGPGTYFSVSYADAVQQGAGGVPIEGYYKNKKKNVPVFEPEFYVPITDNKKIRDVISKVQKGDSAKLLNKYCHDILADEMGIDILFSSVNRGCCAYVVLNDKCMKLKKGW